MVHALEEIHRTLIRKGILLDLRPLANRWPVEVVTGSKIHRLGRLTDLPKGLAYDKAANNAALESARRGWFAREVEEFFAIYLYWDHPEEMATHIAERWADFVKLEEETLRATRAIWHTAGSDRLVRIQMKMLLARWRKR